MCSLGFSSPKELQCFRRCLIDQVKYMGREATEECFLS